MAWFSFSEETNKIDFFIVLLSISVIVALWSVLSTKWRWRLLKNFPGPPEALPLLGNALLLNIENHELLTFADFIVKEYGKVSKIWLFLKPYVIVADADVAEKILNSKMNLDKGDDMKVFHPWWGSGLLTAPANKWKYQRKLLNHTFGHSVLLEFLEIFNKESVLLNRKLGDFARNGETFNMIPYLTATTLNIICETAMGKKLVTEDQINQEYIDAVTGMYHILLARMTRPWLRPNIIWKLSSYGRKEQKYLKILHGFTEKVILEKREQRRAKGKIIIDQENNVEGRKVRMAFMDYLLDLCDNGHELNDQDIRNEVDTFMAAGHDTTAYTVAWTLFLLATYPEHQIKVQEELDNIFGNDKERPVTSADLSNMTYLTLCVKEALRIYPIVPFNFRKLSEDIKYDDKRTIPSGVNVVILPYVIHKDPEHFPSPEEFIPNRFLAENCLKRHPCAYIPFSYGARTCIGRKFGMNEAKVIISYLLRNYNWIAVDKRDQVVLDLDLVIRPMNGLRFKITKRTQ